MNLKSSLFQIRAFMLISPAGLVISGLTAFPLLLEVEAAAGPDDQAVSHSGFSP